MKLTFASALLVHPLFLLVPALSATAQLPARRDGTRNQREPQLAFPGAEGYGRFAKGGRGGDVYHVTNLKDKGPGSLREGIEKRKGPRTIVFDVSGTIRLAEKLGVSDVPGLTIAGQTAPGDGITLRDHTFKIEDCSDIIVRYLRVRLGDASKTAEDAIAIGNVKNAILDHVTATWGVDGTMDTDKLSDFTLQWSIYGEALHDSTHHKGGHAMLMSLRKTKGNVSLHHNLFFSSRNRHPTLGGGKPRDCNTKAIFDFRNNVQYNWEGHTNLAHGQFNLINNYYRPGPNTDRNKHPIAPKAEAHDVTVGYMSGTVYERNPEWTRDNYSAMKWGVRGGNYIGDVTLKKFRLPEEPVAAGDRPVTHSAEEAYRLVLDHAGASRSRDAADERVVRGIRAGTHRRIDSQRDVGGWPELKSKPAPLDTDRDGMPDKWETEHGLDPRYPQDRNGDRDGDGYTNLEEYLDWLLTAPRQEAVEGPEAEKAPARGPAVARLGPPKETVAPAPAETPPAREGIPPKPEPEPRTDRGRWLGVRYLVAGVAVAAILGVTAVALSRRRRPGAGTRPT